MKLIIQLLFVAVFVTVLSAEADKDKSNGEVDSLDVLDKDFYGIETSETDDSDSNSGEEDDREEETTTPGSSRGRGRPSHRHRGKGRHNHRAKTWRKSMTPEEKFEFICRAIKSKTNFMQSRKMSMKLRRIDPEIKEKFEASFAARTAAMSECCKLNGTEALQCAENIRSQRFTRVCNGEEPLNIWSLLKGKKNSNHHSEAISTCCELKDEERNACFITNKQKHVGRVHSKVRKPRDH